MARQPDTPPLPATGYIRQSKLLAYLSFSASTLWRKVKQGTFPAPVKLSERVTAWDLASVHAWLDAKHSAE